jgi:3'-phosphoadenosine 5'-phosphosulfate sulfotransferase (PAPS reductase)/FAD synthetase
VTLHLTVTPSKTGDTTAIVCDSYDWYGTTYTSSGNYPHTLTNAAGCDSVVTLHLTVNHSNTGDTTAIACNSFDWYGTNYTSSGNYTHTLTNAAGCDSVVTLHLTVNYTNAGDTIAIACDSFNWYGTTYTSSGDYPNTLTNAAGCDSVVTLHLTVNHSVAELVEATACGSYLWNDLVYTQSGDYAQTLTAANGCDSVVTMHLTVNHGDYMEVLVDTCGTQYYWALADTTVTQSGVYYHYSANANTCIDTTVLILSLYQSATTEISAQICEGEVYDQNGFNVSTEGDHQLNLQTIHGCDSTVVLHLTVVGEVVTALNASICEGNSFVENGFEILTPEVGVHEYSDTIHRPGTCDSIVT